MQSILDAINEWIKESSFEQLKKYLEENADEWIEW